LLRDSVRVYGNSVREVRQWGSLTLILHQTQRNGRASLSQQRFQWEASNISTAKMDVFSISGVLVFASVGFQVSIFCAGLCDFRASVSCEFKLLEFIMTINDGYTLIPLLHLPKKHTFQVVLIAFGVVEAEDRNKCI